MHVQVRLTLVDVRLSPARSQRSRSSQGQTGVRLRSSWGPQGIRLIWCQTKFKQKNEVNWVQAGGRVEVRLRSTIKVSADRKQKKVFSFSIQRHRCKCVRVLRWFQDPEQDNEAHLHVCTSQHHCGRTQRVTHPVGGCSRKMPQQRTDCALHCTSRSIQVGFSGPFGLNGKSNWSLLAESNRPFSVSMRCGNGGSRVPQGPPPNSPEENHESGAQ